MLVTGCSALRIGYGAAPDVAYWWLDAYVDFDDVQTPRVRDALAQWFAWHRSTQLPDYAVLLDRAQTEVAADTTAARACAWQAELVGRGRTAFDRAVPAIAELLPTIGPEQVRHIERRYRKVNDDFRNDYLQPDPQRRAAAALDRTIERAESLYGRLDDRQRVLVVERLARSPFDPALWLAERRQRQQDALQIVRRFGPDDPGRDPAAAETALRLFAQHLQRSPRDAYRRYNDRLGEFNCAFAAELHNSTSAEQRRTAAQRLAGWAGDLRAVAAAAGRSATPTVPPSTQLLSP